MADLLWEELAEPLEEQKTIKVEGEPGKLIKDLTKCSINQELSQGNKMRI